MSEALPDFQFYRETRFKEVELNGRKVRIPEEWDVIKFGNIALQVVDGTHKTPKYTSEGIPFISTQNLVPFREHFDFSQYRKFISPEEHKELIKRCKPEKGDLLISKCGTIGRTQVVRVDYEFSIFVGVALVKVDKNKADPDYLEQLLNLDLMRKYMEDLSPGATRKTLTLKAIKQMKLFLPSLSEQKKIAEVLRTIDEAIQAVDEGIAKLERLKKGAMERLLTRGINHTRFKEVELNGRKVRIPEEWDFIELKKITEINKESVDPRRVFPDKEFIYIDIDSVENGTGKIRNPKRVLGKNAPSRARRVVHTNDVIMSTVRPYLKAFALIPEEYDGQVCSTGFAVLTPKKQLLHPHYLLYALFSDNTISQCKSMMVGGQYPALTNTQVGQIRIPLPPLSEQKKIAEILRTIDEAIEAKRAKKEKLERMKKVVMEKLLTGKVRIR